MGPVYATCRTSTDSSNSLEAADERRGWTGEVKNRYPRPEADVYYGGVTAGAARGCDGLLRSCNPRSHSALAHSLGFVRLAWLLPL